MEKKLNENKDFNNAQLQLSNERLRKMDSDCLYHLALSTKTHNFEQMFGDTKFVCVGGSARRMEKFSNQVALELGINSPCINLSSEMDRYALFKIGPVLVASHGIGMPSISIMMHEVLKLLYHSRCKNAITFLRLGTCGGLGLKPGSVVISDSAVDGLFRAKYDVIVLGRVVSKYPVVNEEIIQALLNCRREEDQFDCVKGTTMCTYDFYEGQGRLDGAFCGYSEDQKMAFLLKAYKRGVRNIEMESLCFLAMCHQANVNGAVICATLLDRLVSDQISEPKSLLKEWEERPAKIVLRYIQKKLSQKFV